MVRRMSDGEAAPLTSSSSRDCFTGTMRIPTGGTGRLTLLVASETPSEIYRSKRKSVYVFCGVLHENRDIELLIRYTQVSIILDRHLEPTRPTGVDELQKLRGRVGPYRSLLVVSAAW